MHERQCEEAAEAANTHLMAISLAHHLHPQLSAVHELQLLSRLDVGVAKLKVEHEIAFIGKDKPLHSLGEGPLCR